MVEKIVLHTANAEYTRGWQKRTSIAITLSMYHRQQKKCYPILTVANLLAHNNNKSNFVTAVKISFQSAAVNCSFSYNLILLGVTYILLAMIHVTSAAAQGLEAV